MCGTQSRPKEGGKRVGSSTTRVGEVSEQGRGERRLRRGMRRGWEYALAGAALGVRARGSRRARRAGRGWKRG